MRSFFMLHPGLPGPQEFIPTEAKYLSQQDLWAASRVGPPSLLFRVRTAIGAPGSLVQAGDRLESCIGMVDSVTRWRAAFRMAGIALSGIRTPKLARVCGDALQFISSQHPSAVTPLIRRKMLDDIIEAAEEGGTPPWEKRLAGGIAGLAQCDNDFEAAHSVPFISAFMPYQAGSEEYTGRMATIETLSGATLIAEAQLRLAERSPQWMFSQMPSLAPHSTVAAEGVVSDAEDEDDGL